MSHASGSSVTGTRRSVPDSEVYQYALQCAYLAHLLSAHEHAATPAAEAAAAPPPPPASSKRAPRNLSTLADRMRELGTGSAGARTARYPEKLLRKLTERLERIAMGRDAVYNQPLLRQTVGAFYGTMMDPSTVRRLRESRRVEELIMTFISTAQSSLRKRVPNEAERKQELDSQTEAFVHVLQECLRSVGGSTRELSERMDECVSLLNAEGPGGAASPAPGGTASPAAGSDGTPGLVLTDRAALDSPLVAAVGRLFRVETEQLAQDVAQRRTVCTLKAAVLDLKLAVRRIHAQAAWPARQDDFVSPEEYKRWRTVELAELSQRILQLCQLEPELLQTATTSAPGSARPSISSRTDGERPSLSARTDSGSRTSLDSADASPFFDALEASEEFTYIPQDPGVVFGRLLERCVDADLEQIRRQDANDEVPLSILSSVHSELLDTCAQWWLVPRVVRTTHNLRAIKVKFDCSEVPLECIGEALVGVGRLLRDSGGSSGSWRRQDRQRLVRTLSALVDSLLRTVYPAMEHVVECDAAEVMPALSMVQDILHTGLLGSDGSVAVERLLDSLRDAARVAAIQSYTDKTTSVFSQAHPSVLDTLMELLGWIERNIKTLEQRFAAPVLGIVPVDLVLARQIPLFLEDLEAMRETIQAQVIAADSMGVLNDAFVLYHRIRALLRMYASVAPTAEASFSLRRWFLPFVEHWLLLPERRAREWGNNAILADSFEPVDAELAYSSSINDLSDALRQPVHFVLELEWPDAYEQACFLTTLSKVITRLIEQYCHGIEDLFMDEMLMRSDATPTGGFSSLIESSLANAPLNPRQAAWVNRAKQTIAGERRVEPFHFQPRSCVKLNNVEAARKLLDLLYQRIDADKQASIVQAHLRSGDADSALDADDSVASVASRDVQTHYIFTLKLVQAELAAAPWRDTDGVRGPARVDTFVTLSDDRGERLAKTRTIYDTLSPRWEEVFDISVTTPIWVSATVWGRRLNFDPVLHGRASLRLDPALLGDQAAHELWLDLDSGGGKLLLRISMEDAHDDILFHFGRAFRVLKRCEADMVRVIVDRMSIFMRQFLSRAVVKSLVQGGRINLDKAIDNVKALYASALASANGSAVMIPPVDRERPRRQAAVLSDQEIEAAIVPLLDYLEESLGTLKSSLSDDEAQLVLTKVWKEVLVRLEGLLVPPLSDAPCSMRQLSDKEVDIVFKWLSFLKSFFNAYDPETGVAHGIPLDVLQGPKYRELLSYLLLHDQSTDELMIECVRGFQAHLAKAPAARTKSVLNQRSLGTIRKHKRVKAEEDQPSLTDMAMKILRMRPGTGDFLSQQLVSMNSLQQAVSVKRPPPARRDGASRPPGSGTEPRSRTPSGAQGGVQGGVQGVVPPSGVPPVPPVPPDVSTGGTAAPPAAPPASGPRDVLPDAPPVPSLRRASRRLPMLPK